MVTVFWSLSLATPNSSAFINNGTTMMILTNKASEHQSLEDVPWMFMCGGILLQIQGLFFFS
jgi:hypothetical protein